MPKNFIEYLSLPVKCKSIAKISCRDLKLTWDESVNFPTSFDKLCWTLATINSQYASSKINFHAIQWKFQCVFDSLKNDRIYQKYFFTFLPDEISNITMISCLNNFDCMIIISLRFLAKDPRKICVTRRIHSISGFSCPLFCAFNRLWGTLSKHKNNVWCVARFGTICTT